MGVKTVYSGSEEKVNIPFPPSPNILFPNTLQKGVLKICSKFAVKLHEITLRHWCSPVNLLHVFRTPFYRSTYRGLLLNLSNIYDRKFYIP